MARVPGGFGVSRPDRSVSLGFAGDVAGDPLSYALPDLPLKDLERAAKLAEELESIVGRMPPGSFTQDPGMRAGDEFTDVGSAGYNERAKRVAERGGAEEYATSVEEEQAAKHADELRTQVLLALLMSMGVGGVGAVGRAARPLTRFQRGTLGQTGAQPGVGRALFGRPSARQASANRGIGAGRHSADDTLGVLDEAFASNQGTGLLGKIIGSSGAGAERRLRDTMLSRYMRG